MLHTYIFWAEVINESAQAQRLLPYHVLDYSGGLGTTATHYHHCCYRSSLHAFKISVSYKIHTIHTWQWLSSWHHMATCYHRDILYPTVLRKKTEAYKIALLPVCYIIITSEPSRILWNSVGGHTIEDDLDNVLLIALLQQFQNGGH